MRIAVVGSGIAGLGAAWSLARTHDVTVFEARDRLGGHSHTVDVAFEGAVVPVDTGFIVYNEPTYPHLTNLFRHLDVPTEPSDMSFAFSRGAFEYGGNLRGLLARPSQLASRRYRRMIADILRFRSTGLELLDRDIEVSLGAMLDAADFGPGFRDDYIIPMAAAIWSARPDQILDFPARSFLQFFKNHGLIQLTDRPQWRTVTGGSRTYVEAIVASSAFDVRLSSPVTSITRASDSVTVAAAGTHATFDHVVFACHTDQTTQILGAEATDAERNLLSSVRYEPNQVVLHSDPTLMPRRRSAWSSWNSMAEPGSDGDRPPSVTYWMNRLQNIDPRHQLFVSLNPIRPPDPDLVHGSYTYAHPQFDRRAVEAQQHIASLQGRQRSWFAGAWCGYGFHEDGLQSGLNVAAALGSPAPWHHSVVPMSSAPAVPITV